MWRPHSSLQLVAVGHLPALALQRVEKRGPIRDPQQTSHGPLDCVGSSHARLVVGRGDKSLKEEENNMPDQLIRSQLWWRRLEEEA